MAQVPQANKFKEAHDAALQKERERDQQAELVEGVRQEQLEKEQQEQEELKQREQIRKEELAKIEERREKERLRLEETEKLTGKTRGGTTEKAKNRQLRERNSVWQNKNWRLPSNEDNSMTKKMLKAKRALLDDKSRLN